MISNTIDWPNKTGLKCQQSRSLKLNFKYLVSEAIFPLLHFKAVDSVWCSVHQHFTHGSSYESFAQSFFFCAYILGLNFIWRTNIGANALIKYWWNWPHRSLVCVSEKVKLEFVTQWEKISCWHLRRFESSGVNPTKLISS